MLASTVQFSNNDQTPTLRTRRHLAWSRHPRGNNRSLRTQQRARHKTITHRVPRRSSTDEGSCPVPNSQRSTHEQALRNTRPKLLCAP